MFVVHVGSKGTLLPLLQSWLRGIESCERLESGFKLLSSNRLVTFSRLVRLFLLHGFVRGRFITL